MLALLLTLVAVGQEAPVPDVADAAAVDARSAKACFAPLFAREEGIPPRIELHVSVAVDGIGVLTGVTPDDLPESFHICARAAVSAMVFRGSDEVQAVSLPFVLHDGGPVPPPDNGPQVGPAPTPKWARGKSERRVRTKRRPADSAE